MNAGTRKKRLYLSLPTFSLLLLLPLLLLLLGGSGMFIHYSREITNDSSQVLGAHTASLELSARVDKIQAFFREIAISSSQEKRQRFEQCRNALRDLGSRNAHLLPKTSQLLKKLDALEKIQAVIPDSAATDGSENKLAQELIRSLSRELQQLLLATRGTEKLTAQLKANIVSARELENLVLVFIALVLASLVLMSWQVKLEIIRPLMGIRSYATRLGTGVAMHEPPDSRVLTISDIAEALGNLAVYLGQATVESEKIMYQAKRFRTMSLSDGLTGLKNRRAFDDQLSLVWKNAQQKKSRTAVIMLDVDKFKLYNDSLGHQAGDDCLCQVAGAIAGAVAESAFAARYGGEEFVVLKPDTDREAALALAEKIRKAVVDLKLPHPASPAGPYVTVSLGVAAESPDAVTTAEELLHLADEALYFSKENGRNRATVSSGLPPGG